MNQSSLRGAFFATKQSRRFLQYLSGLLRCARNDGMAMMFLLFLTCGLTACSTETHYAPVVDIATIEHVPKNGMYRVASGETLYSIAWRYGLDYRYVANLNHMTPPYHVVTGQRLSLSEKSAGTHPIKSTKSNAQPHIVSTHSVKYVEHESNIAVTAWRWPAHGPIVSSYSSLNKGVNIGGSLGNPIYATASGQVVYSGSGLRGYGNLIIIKHNSTYLSAYAHNKVILVKEGQRVKAGQLIAEMGRAGVQQTMLHFEIRRNGQPVNPLNYLS